MDKKKLYKNASVVLLLVGIGMILGHNLASGTSNNGLWVGFILLFGAAATFGMSTATPEKGAAPEPDQE